MSLSSRWYFPSTSEDRIRALAAELKIGLPAARVLCARGYDNLDSAVRFLRPSLEHLHDPHLLRDMDRAVERLYRAIQSKEKILLYGDYDVDGTSSVVILKKLLDLAGAQADFHVPHRLRDGYGMRPEVIERAAADNVRLVVSVDTGIRAAAVVEHARALGIDVIVTDHHLPEAELPPALAVLNPNRPDCGYPEKNLCGAGVAFKLVQALLKRMDWPADRVRRMTESFLKLVAVATVADVVPLTGENRVIVKCGLDGFHTMKNPGLRALLRVSGFQDGECPSARQVAFQIAPRINAAGRMANASDVISLFLTDDEQKATNLASQLHALNKERQETEAEIVAHIVEECSRVPVTDSQAALVFSGKNWHRGVVGIVASRVVERFHRPAFVISEDEETGIAQGSGRSIPAFHLLDSLESMPDLFTKFGGHRQAAGLTLRCDRVAEFRDRLNAYAAQRLTPDDFCPSIELDAVLSFQELTERSVMEVLGLAPFGFGNHAPVFGVMGAEIRGPASPIGEKHLRVPVRHSGRTVFLKAWHFAQRANELQQGRRVDVAICVEEDAYSAARGFPGWCAVLKDVRTAEAAIAANGHITSR